ncbi:MAG TPA: cytochrome c oxidase subunit 3 [Microbacteriaceae bacterium]|nr:cytochrome c oxidase subunit 3 [Microbacteriaceae bacterium]
MSTAALAPPTVNRPNVTQVGVIVWLGSEVMFFAGIFAIYFTLRSTSPELWAIETEKLTVPFSSVNTAVLVLSSFTAQFGVFAAERLQAKRLGSRWNLRKWGATEWFWLSFILGAIFVVGQVYEYALLTSEHLTLNSSAYGTIFYFATGIHGIHVTAGLVAFLFVIGRFYAVKRFTHREAVGAIAISYYWHFVDVVWVALFAVIYLLQ